MSAQESHNDPLFSKADIIYSYTRKEAIEDGFLVDVSDHATEVGFTHHVAMTRAAWEDCCAWSERDRKKNAAQDEVGRLHDVLYMASVTVRAANHSGNTSPDVFYRLRRVPRVGYGRKQLVELKINIGPGDQGEPVLTIMQSHED